MGAENFNFTVQILYYYKIILLSRRKLFGNYPLCHWAK